MVKRSNSSNPSRRLGKRNSHGIWESFEIFGNGEESSFYESLCSRRILLQPVFSFELKETWNTARFSHSAIFSPSSSHIFHPKIRSAAALTSLYVHPRFLSLLRRRFHARITLLRRRFHASILLLRRSTVFSRRGLLEHFEQQRKERSPLSMFPIIIIIFFCFLVFRLLFRVCLFFFFFFLSIF